jgi:hypothetical protein
MPAKISMSIRFSPNEEWIIVTKNREINITPGRHNGDIKKK